MGSPSLTSLFLNGTLSITFQWYIKQQLVQCAQNQQASLLCGPEDFALVGNIQYCRRTIVTVEQIALQNLSAFEKKQMSVINSLITNSAIRP